MPETVADQQNLVSPSILALREDLREGRMRRIARFALGDLDVEVCQGRDAIWCLIRRQARGGLALRAAYLDSASFTCRRSTAEPGPWRR